MDNNIKTNDPQIIADEFNDFFSTIGTNLSKHMAQTTQESHRKFLNNTILTLFNFSLTSELDRKKIVSAL